MGSIFKGVLAAGASLAFCLSGWLHPVAIRERRIVWFSSALGVIGLWPLSGLCGAG